MGQLTEDSIKLQYTEFRSQYTRLDGVHRHKTFYYEKYGQYCNAWRLKHGDER